MELIALSVSMKILIIIFQKKKDVGSLIKSSTSKQTKVWKDIQTIIYLYQEDEQKIQIIGNNTLSVTLQSIADPITDGIKKDNQDMIENIWNTFRGGASFMYSDVLSVIRNYIGLSHIFGVRWDSPPNLSCIPKQPDSLKMYLKRQQLVKKKKH